MSEPAQSFPRSQPHSISPSTLFRSSQVSSPQQLDDELDLIPNLVVSTPKFSPPQTRQGLSQALQFVCVEIPPLSPGKNMTNYRSLKELKYVRGVPHTQHFKPKISDTNHEIVEPEQERHCRKKKGKRKWVRKKKNSETNLDPIISATTLPGTQSRQEEKLVLYDPLPYQLNGSSSKNINPTVTNVSEEEDQQNLLPVPTSCEPVSSLSISSFHPDERGKSAPEPPFPTPEHEIDNNYMASDTPVIQDIELQNLEHVPAAIVYFNTRFSQNTVDASKWILLGTRARLNCVKSHRSFLGDKNEEQKETEGDLSAGAPLSWRGCTSSDEPSSSSRRKEQAGITIAEKLSGKVGLGRAASSPTSTPFPKLDLAEVYKSQNSASSQKGQRRRGRGVKLQREDLTGSLNTVADNSASSEETQVHPTIVAIQDISFRLSEKARGKQKAVDPDFLDDTIPYLPTAPTDTPPSSYPTFDPHDTFDRNMGDYVSFSLSLDKPSDYGSENNMTGSAFSLAAVSTSHSSTIVPQYHKNPFRSQSNLEDIFLAPQALGSPESSSFNSTGNGNYLQLNDPCRIVCLEGENNLDELVTINPAFLGGGPEVYDGDLQDSSIDLALGRMSATEITLGHKGDLNTTVSSDTQLDSMKGQSTTDSSFSTVSSSSSPQSSSTWSSQTRNYPVKSSRVPVDTKTLVSDKDQDEEDREVPRGLVDCLEESAGSFLSKDVPPTKLPHQTLATQIKQPLNITLKHSKSMFSRTRQKARGRPGQQYPMGKEEAYCHQCRRKSRYLKMSCPCSKKYCSRCMALR